VAVPKGDVPLGNSVEVTLTLAPGKLVDLSSVQRSAGNVVFQSGRPATILRDDGITKTIAVVPAQLGPVDLEIAAAYSDNAVAMHTIRLNVVPSANGLKQFVINGGNIALPLVLEDLEENRQSRINPYVTYRSLDYPIGLSSCEHIKFSIEQSNAVGGPIVEIGRDCMVHALREGKGYLVGDFEGLKDRMLVTVYTKENAPPEFRRARP
jgi:hypothetical protein